MTYKIKTLAELLADDDAYLAASEAARTRERILRSHSDDERLLKVSLRSREVFDWGDQGLSPWESMRRDLTIAHHRRKGATIIPIARGKPGRVGLDSGVLLVMQSSTAEE